MDNWRATIIWTIGNGDNTSTLDYGATREKAKRELVKAEKMLRQNGARIRVTKLFRG